ncbi:hypothetical protein ACTFIY_006009 [Dictyostelium cf. discoideum]
MLGSLSSFHTSIQQMIKYEVCSLNIASKQPSIASNDMGNEITFIEVSPHPTLQFYFNQMKSTHSSYFGNDCKKITIYSPLNKKKNDYNEFLKTISLLYVNNNLNINFKSQLLTKYFKLNSRLEKIKSEGPSIHNLGNNTDSPYTSYQTFIHIKKSPFQWLKGHQVCDEIYYPGMGYVHNLLSIYLNQDITIVEALKPILNEPIKFRILEVGGTGSLSLLILEKICKLLNDNSATSIIDIEFTWSDISASFFAENKEKLSPFTNYNNLNIIYRVLDLEKPLFDQDLKASYYDFVVMSNVIIVTVVVFKI